MGLIQIENMEFYSFHGHFREEQIVGSRFLVDLTIKRICHCRLLGNQVVLPTHEIIKRGGKEITSA